MSDVVTEEEKRLIAVDAKAAAKNGFPQVKIVPSEEHGEGTDQCQELLLKFCEATAQVLGGDVGAMRAVCDRARHEEDPEVSFGETVH
eukprot:8027534-Alexandrium_andersonii.AAC.1